MIHKLTLIQTDGIFIVSDDGYISRTLGVTETPWHLVARNQEELAIRITQMNKLIEDAKSRAAIGFNLVDGSTTVTSAAATTTATTAPGNGATHRFNLPGKGTVAARADLDTLALKYQQLWRLRKHGIKTVGQLVGYSADELVALKGIGVGLVGRVETALAAKGYRLKEAVA